MSSSPLEASTRSESQPLISGGEEASRSIIVTINDSTSSLRESAAVPSTKQQLPTTRLWDADYCYMLSGDIVVHEVLLYILTFIEVDKRTLFHLGGVSYGWRERANHMPQWVALFNREYSSYNRGISRILAMGSKALYSSNEDEEETGTVRSREGYIEYHLAEVRARVAIKRSRIKWMAFPIFYFWVMFAAVMGVAFAIGYLPNNNIEGDVKVGATSGCVAFLMWLCFIVSFTLWYNKKQPSHLLTRFVDIVLSHSFFITPAFLIGAVVVALLASRLQALHQLNDMPTLNLTCNSPANHVRTAVDNLMPAQVFVSNTSFFQRIASGMFTPSTTNASISYILVVANSSLLSPAQRCAPFSGEGGYLAGDTLLALSVSSFTATENYDWPPKNGSAFFRTPTNQKYFSMDPNSALDRLWYEESPMWKEHGIPLVTKNNYDDLAEVQKDYEKYLMLVLVVCFQLLLLPFLRLAISDEHSQAWSFAIFMFLLLIFNPFTLATVGGVCLWFPQDWCMIGHTASLVLFCTGAGLIGLLGVIGKAME